MIKRVALAISIAFAFVAAFFCSIAPASAQVTPPFVSYPAAGWVPYASGPMVTKVTTQYGPNPLASECAFTPPPVQNSTGTNSCIDAHSSTIVANIWGTSATTGTQSTPGPYGAGLGKIDVYLGGPTAALAIINAGNVSSPGYAYYQSKSTDPLFCIPVGTEEYGEPSRPGLLHVPAGAIPELDADHHMIVFDTASGIHWHLEEVGVPAQTTGVTCTINGITAPIMPWIEATAGATPFGTPPPDNSVGASDAYQPGAPQNMGTYPSSASASTEEGIGMYAIAGGISLEWSIRAADILAGRIPHALIFSGNCDTEANPSSTSGPGTYVYPVIMNRTGYNTDNAHYCADNTTSLLYGAHIWLDEGPQATTGTDGCDQTTYAVVKALNEFGAYKNTIASPLACTGSSSGCSGDSAINFSIIPDLSDTYSGNLNCGGGTVACTDSSTNPSPWYQIISNLHTLSGGSTGAIFSAGGTEGFTYPSGNGRYQLYLPGQSLYQGSPYQNIGGTGANLNTACGVNLASHMHVLIAPPHTPFVAATAAPAIVISPSSFTFALDTSAAQTGAITDVGNTATLTATIANTSVATVAVTAPGSSSATITVTPVGVGTTTITVTDGTLTKTAAVTVTAQSIPAATYTNATPGPPGSYPVAIDVPVAATNTYTMIVNCPVNSLGNGALGVTGTLDVIAGQCDGSNNTGSSTEAHNFNVVSFKQATPTNDLPTSTSYFIAAENDGAYDQWIQCALPNTTTDCVEYTSPADTTTFTAASSVAAYVGSDRGEGRVMGTGGWVAAINAYPKALNLSNVNILSASASAANPYPTPTPTAAPIVFATPSLTFALDSSAAQTVGVTDASNTGGSNITATIANTAIATASITSGATSDTITVTPVNGGSIGTTTLTAADGVRTASINVTVTAQAIPTPSYFNATPMGTTGATPLPVTVTVPVFAQTTFVGIVNCPANTSGNALFSVVGVMDLIAGQCNGSSNTGTSSEAHYYDIVNGVQAVPANDLPTSTTEFVAGSNDGTNIYWTQCALPNTTSDCVTTAAATPDPVLYTPAASATGYIGSDVASGRVMATPGWIAGVGVYNKKLNLASLNTLSAAASANDPYPTPTPTAAPTSTPAPISTAYSDANPPPLNWRPRSITGTYSLDGQHVTWDAICAQSSPPISCVTTTDSSGNKYVDPPYTAINDGSTKIVNAIANDLTFSICTTVGTTGTHTGADGNTYQGSSNCLATASKGDYGYGVFFTGNTTGTPAPSETMVGRTINCTVYNANGNCGTSDPAGNAIQGSTRYFPTYSMGQFDGDGHAFLFDELDKQELECWHMNDGDEGSGNPNGQFYMSTSQAGTTLNCASFSIGRLDVDQQDIAEYNGPFTGSAFSDEGIGVLIRGEEMNAAISNPDTAISHMIGVSLAQEGPSPTYYTWPAAKTDGNCTTTNKTATTSDGIEGMVVYLDSQGYKAAMADTKASPYWKAVMAAAHHHGFMATESGACDSAYNNVEFWGSQSYVAANQAASAAAGKTVQVVVNPWDAFNASATSSDSAGDLLIDSTNSSVTVGRFHIPAAGSSTGYGWDHFHVLNLGCNYYLFAGAQNTTKGGLKETCPTSSTVANGSPYSALFTGNTPFHHKVATLIGYSSHPATVVSNSSAIASYLIGTGYNSRPIEGVIAPMWQSASGQTARTYSCNTASHQPGLCIDNGITVYLPSYAQNQCYDPGNSSEDACNYDYHMSIIDTYSNNAEIDGWECGSGATNSTGSNLWDCEGSGFYSFSGSGLSYDAQGTFGTQAYAAAVAGGYAVGLGDVTPQDLTNGFSHALTFVATCAENPSVYPSGTHSDATCGSSQTGMAYGMLMHIKASVDISSLGGSKECQNVLQALQTYGMYEQDTSPGYGITLNAEPYIDYSLAGVSPNPWDAVISDMKTAGEGSGSGASFTWSGCSKYWPSASSWEVVELNQGGTADLPPISTP